MDYRDGDGEVEERRGVREVKVVCDYGSVGVIFESELDQFLGTSGVSAYESMGNSFN